MGGGWFLVVELKNINSLPTNLVISLGKLWRLLCPKGSSIPFILTLNTRGSGDHMCCYLKLNTFLGHWWRVWLIGGLGCYISPFIRYLAPHQDFPDRIDIKKMVGCLPAGSSGKLRQLVVHQCRFSLYWGPAACVSMQWSETFWNVVFFHEQIQMLLGDCLSSCQM